MSRYHEVEFITFKGENLILKIEGQEYNFLLSDISSKLANASKDERNIYQISCSGYGIHWPLIDEDLSIDALLGVKHKPIQINDKVTV